MKRKHWIIIVAFNILIFILLNPYFWFICGSKYIKGKIIEELVLRIMTENLTQGSVSDQEKALKLFNYVDTHIFHKNLNAANISDTKFLKSFVNGKGWCDEQTKALSKLARKAGLRAR